MEKRRRKPAAPAGTIAALIAGESAVDRGGEIAKAVPALIHIRQKSKTNRNLRTRSRPRLSGEWPEVLGENSTTGGAFSAWPTCSAEVAGMMELSWCAPS